MSTQVFMEKLKKKTKKHYVTGLDFYLILDIFEDRLFPFDQYFYFCPPLTFSHQNLKWSLGNFIS